MTRCDSCGRGPDRHVTAGDYRIIYTLINHRLLILTVTPSPRRTIPTR